MSNLKRIWTGMLTNEGRWDGSRNQTVLIINQRGQDQLHHTFPKGNPPHQGRGQANLYEIDVTENQIDTKRLNTSSIRVGLRGQDYWRPQHVLVWGEVADKNQIIPLAAERDLAVKVSHDPKEGLISFPLRPIGAGTDDIPLTHLILMIKTSEVKNAGSSSDIRLQIIDGKEPLLDYTLPDTPQADHETGQANFYMIPLERSFSKTMLQANSIRLINNGTDSWLPKSCFLFGFNQKARRSEFLVTLVHLFEWSFGWLSSDKMDNAKRAVALPLFSQDHPLKGNRKRESTQEVKAGKKEHKAKAEVVSQQQSHHSQTVKSQKEEEGKWVWFEDMAKAKQAKNQHQKNNKTSPVVNKTHKGKENMILTHHRDQPKVKKSYGHQQTETEGQSVWIEESLITQEQVTTIQTAELVPA